MKSENRDAGKELYRQLRRLSCDALWKNEVPLFEKSDTAERIRRVSVIRAVGVAFSKHGTTEQKAEVRAWLVRLLQDPSEKVRRYAMAALPKLGAGAGEEAELLSLLKQTTVEREKTYLCRSLDKIGGTATLAAVIGAGLLPQTELKVKASVARKEKPSSIRMNGSLPPSTHLHIHLRGRKGLEKIVRDEVEAYIRAHGKFRIADVRSGLVAISPVAPFSLADIYSLRCFGTAGFVLGTVQDTNPAEFVEALASAITSPLSRSILTALTEGAIRYRLDFVSKGHQRGAVRLVANRAYKLCPGILNDARESPWAIDIHESRRGSSVELRPRFAPDPRFYYRRQDVPAASHPPLAACMARIAGKVSNEIVWDPFCGSGLELVERALLGGVRKVFGTDLSADAVAVVQANFAAADARSVQSKFVCCDFRDFARIEGLGPNSVTLMITNPPMGRRIRLPDIRGLFADLFKVAAAVLTPGGRLVFANPLRINPTDPSLKLQFRQVVDLGGFDCRLEIYRKETPKQPSN